MRMWINRLLKMLNNVASYIKTSSRQSYTITGHRLGFLPAEISPVTSNPNCVRNERQLALKTCSTIPPGIVLLNLTSSGKTT